MYYKTKLELHRAGIYLSLFWLFFGMVYLIFAVIGWDINARNWPQDARSFMAFLGSCVGGLGTMFSAIYLEGGFFPDRRGRAERAEKVAQDLFMRQATHVYAEYVPDPPTTELSTLIYDFTGP